MIDINLLPPEYAPKKLVNLSNLAIIGIFFLIGLSLILCSLRLLAAVQDYSGKVEYHNEQIKHYKQQVEDIRELGKRVKSLKGRLSLVKDLLQERTSWSNKLVDLLQCLPEDGIWIDDLTIKPMDASNTPVAETKTAESGEKPADELIVINISGTVASVDKVSQFVANLEDSGIFSNVIFDSATSNLKSGSNDLFITFKLSVQILNPTPFKF